MIVSIKVLSGIEIAAGHRTISDKILDMSGHYQLVESDVLSVKRIKINFP